MVDIPARRARGKNSAFTAYRLGAVPTLACRIGEHTGYGIMRPLRRPDARSGGQPDARVRCGNPGLEGRGGSCSARGRAAGLLGGIGDWSHCRDGGECRYERARHGGASEFRRKDPSPTF